MKLQIGRFVKLGTVRGEPMRVGDRQLVPVARTISVALSIPGFPLAGGFTWVRPIAVDVTDEAGSRRIPIPNVGTKIMLGLTAVGALSALAYAFLRPGRGSAIEENEL